MLGLGLVAALGALAVFVGHPSVVREDRRRLDQLRPHVGHMVTVTAGHRFPVRRTGVIELDHHKRKVQLEVAPSAGFLGLPGPSRTFYIHPGEIRRVEDCETGAVIRWS